MTNTEEIISDPISWVSGGLASLSGAIYMTGVDPISAIAVLMDVGLSNATNVFTAASIAGFTLAPEVDWLPAGSIKVIALVFGAIVALKLLHGVGVAFINRLKEEA